LSFENLRISPRHRQRRNPARHDIRERAMFVRSIHVGRVLRSFGQVTQWSNLTLGERYLDVWNTNTLGVMPGGCGTAKQNTAQNKPEAEDDFGFHGLSWRGVAAYFASTKSFKLNV
jgi:hypothetical protein